VSTIIHGLAPFGKIDEKIPFDKREIIVHLNKIMTDRKQGPKKGDHHVFRI
jgi:hypothetical protein